MSELYPYNETKVTGTGQVVGFTALSEPRAYQNGTPQYTCKLALDSTSEECIKLVQEIDLAISGAGDYLNMLADRYGKQEKLSAAKLRKLANTPYEPEYDEGDQETGRTLFKFRQNNYVYAASAKVPFTLPIVDSQREPMSEPIYQGSTVKIMFLIKPWYVASTGLGVSLRPQAVQVIDLVSAQDQSNSVPEFAKVDGGYIAQANTPIIQSIPTEPDVSAFDEL